MQQFESTYHPNGSPLAHRVYSVGVTIESALEALGAKIGWGKITIIDSHSPKAHDRWYCHFMAEDSSMLASGWLASGWLVAGGVVVDWWQ